MATNIQEILRGLSDEFSKLQQEQQAIIVAQQRFNAQKTENEGVMKEFEKLEESETIYKLVGPVLLKQDKIEAGSTVQGRLDFIKQELARLESEIKESNQAMDKVRDQILALQSSAQSGPGSGAGHGKAAAGGA